ncbi:MAG: metalloregulator ArsR/SmtB family transcription factor [Alphaproteobacteria bacterium]|nr:metalloregulator ArsR/SmtB family transcription factor [Alphaproteobacteria bacterium]
MEALMTGLRAAAEPTRLRILGLCAEGELSVGELTEILGQSQPRVSRHLKLLCEAGLLERQPEGSSVLHRLASDGPPSAIARTLVDLIPARDPIHALDLERLAEIQARRTQAAADYFRRNASGWDAIRSLYVDEQEVERAMLERLAPGRARNLLDIGTGTGRILELLGGRVDHAVGVDLSRDMLAMARDRIGRARLTHCQLRLGDMYRLPMAGAAFDLVTIHQVLHFADRPAAAIAEAARVLRPGGRLILVDFARHDLDFVQQEHAHRRLGIADEEVAAWCDASGLAMGKAVRLPGKPLTVVIWVADRPRPAQTETPTETRAASRARQRPAHPHARSA